MLDGTEIRTEHKDVIHDVSYDYYGKRMATCSSDQTVKVFYTFPVLAMHGSLFMEAVFLCRCGTKRPTALGQ